MFLELAQGGLADGVGGALAKSGQTRTERREVGCLHGDRNWLLRAVSIYTYLVDMSRTSVFNVCLYEGSKPSRATNDWLPATAAAIKPDRLPQPGQRHRARPNTTGQPLYLDAQS